MPVESDGHSRGNPRLYELFENAPKTGKSPTVWAFPELVDFLKVAGQPVTRSVASAPAAAARPAELGRRCRWPSPDPAATTQPRPHPEPPEVRMYPSRFRYEAPRSIDEALDLLRAGGGEAKVLAGGQSLVPLLKLRFASPELLVDINNLPGLDYHRADPDGTIRDRRAVPARRPRALRAPRRPAADDGRGRPHDRRPHRPQPRHAGRLAVPRRPAGRLGLGRARRSAVTSSRRDRAAAAPSRWREFVTGPFQNVLAPDEIAVEAVIPAPGHPGGRLPQAGAPGRRLRHRRGRGRGRDLRRAWSPGPGIALTGVGGSTIDGHRGGRRHWSAGR